MRNVNLARIELPSLKLLCACQKFGSVSAAARHCHLSVMGASGRLRRLEEALGRTLFIRVRNGLIVTPAGVAAVKGAVRILEMTDALLLDVQDADDHGVMHENPGRGRR